MKHIHWLWRGLTWSCDATEYGPDGILIIPVQDLASRYRFTALVIQRLDGRQIAAHLETLFRQHGAPLFLKRDNGSPFAHHAGDQLLARCGVLPLNNRPTSRATTAPWKKASATSKPLWTNASYLRPPSPTDFALAVELTAHQLNHQPRRCLNGRCACLP